MRTWEQIPVRQRPAYRPCPECGGPRAKHAAYCRRCSPLYASGEKHPAWKGDAASDVKKRKRVANPRLEGPCEKCGAPGVDRHHIDGDPGHNVPENIALLCRRCHMLEDGRLAKLAATNPKVQPAKPCVRCKRLSKPLRRGRCGACNEYLRRTGRERPFSVSWEET